MSTIQSAGWLGIRRREESGFHDRLERKSLKSCPLRRGRSEWFSGFLLIMMGALSVFCERAGAIPSNYLVRSEMTNDLGVWIWTTPTLDKQTVQLWKSFEVPSGAAVKGAELSMAADNAFKVWVDGKEIGSGSDWRTLSIYHLSGTLTPGTHVVAVEGFNDADKAGVIAGLRLEMADGTSQVVRSDTNWRVVPSGEEGWQTATKPSPKWRTAAFIARIGDFPWWTIPTTALQLNGTLPEPVNFLQTRAFQRSLLAGCVIFAAICLYLLMRLMSQSRAHSLVQVERDRIARDIHDDLGSNITQMLLTCEMAKIKEGASAEKNGVIVKMCESTRDILGAIDEVVWIVDSQQDRLDDFAIYICKYAQRFVSTSTIRCRLDVAHDLPDRTLNQLVRRNLFLAVKESLNNAVKHSSASELTVRIKLEDSVLRLMVEDNGTGFDAGLATHEGNGLSNMSMRMNEIGGSCEIKTQPAGGATICFTVSLKPVPFYTQWWRTLFQKHSRQKVHDNGITEPSPTETAYR